MIKDVDYKDRGVYSCNASNGMSFVTMEFTLSVRGEFIIHDYLVIINNHYSISLYHALDEKKLFTRFFIRNKLSAFSLNVS